MKYQINHNIVPRRREAANVNNETRFAGLVFEPDAWEEIRIMKGSSLDHTHPLSLASMLSTSLTCLSFFLQSTSADYCVKSFTEKSRSTCKDWQAQISLYREFYGVLTHCGWRAVAPPFVPRLHLRSPAALNRSQR